MNEGLDLRVLQIDETELQPAQHGWYEETERQFNRGWKDFERNHPMQRVMNFRDRHAAEVSEQLNKRKARK